ncbi:hypothetical protein GQ457_06G009390 [Hibiscus cannabinus]
MMMGYIQTLEKLRFPLKNELAIDAILQSLSDSFKPFILNFNMNEIDKTLPQLFGMLRTAESKLEKNESNSIQIVREAKGNRKKMAKSKGNKESKPEEKDSLKLNEELVKKESVSTVTNSDIRKETAQSILKKSRRLKQLEHQLLVFMLLILSF